MIVEFFLSPIWSLVNFVLDLLPAVTVPSGINDAITWFFTTLHSLDVLLPTGDIIGAIYFLLIFRISWWIMAERTPRWLRFVGIGS